MNTNFYILNDKFEKSYLIDKLNKGNDIVIINSPSKIYNNSISFLALDLMRKYPERKIFVTSPTNSNIFNDVIDKANSGANILDTYIYAENIALKNKN